MITLLKTYDLDNGRVYVVLHHSEPDLRCTRKELTFYVERGRVQYLGACWAEDCEPVELSSKSSVRRNAHQFLTRYLQREPQ